jgi:hypothetical protein
MQQLPRDESPCRCIDNDRLAMERLRIALQETERLLYRARKTLIDMGAGASG